MTASDVSRESELLVAVGHGDRDAFSELYERVIPRAFGLIVRVLVDRAQSEEVAQDVMLEVWQRASGFDPEKGTAVGWIRRLARGRAIDRVRTAEASSERSQAAGIRELVIAPDTPDEIVESRLGSERLLRAVARLRETHRQVIALCHLEGYSQREVAEQLGIPIGTVKWRTHEAMKQLRLEMGAAAA